MTTRRTLSKTCDQLCSVAEDFAVTYGHPRLALYVAILRRNDGKNPKALADDIAALADETTKLSRRLYSVRLAQGLSASSRSQVEVFLQVSKVLALAADCLQRSQDHNRNALAKYPSE